MGPHGHRGADRAAHEWGGDLGRVGQRNRRQGYLPCALVLPCVCVHVPTVTAVPSTPGEASVAPLDARPSSCCETAVAAFVAADSAQGA